MKREERSEVGGGNTKIRARSFEPRPGPLFLCSRFMFPLFAYSGHNVRRQSTKGGRREGESKRSKIGRRREREGYQTNFLER